MLTPAALFGRIRKMIPSVFAIMFAAAALQACASVTVTPTPASSAAPSAEPGVTQAPIASASPSPALATPLPSSSGSTFEACGLFSGAELSTMLGIDGVQPRPMPSAGWVAGQCAWNGPASGFFLAVGTPASLEAAGDAAAPNAKAKFAQFREQAGGASAPKDVPGIGDGAVLVPTGLAAYSGGTYLQITNLGLTDDQLIEIAKLAVTRL